MRNAFLAMLVSAFSTIAVAQVTVVRAGRLVDPDSGTVLTHQIIVVDGEGFRPWAGAREASVRLI